MHASLTAHRKAALWLAAIVGVLAFSLANAPAGMAEESNPNNYNCLGSTSAGQPEPGSEEQQVQYSFYCNGPITGYQIESQLPVTGISSPPNVTSNATKALLGDTFSCSGEIPGWAANCVGATKAGYETITGQFAIGSKICKEPRVDPLLTVVYAYLEKGVITQAIAGPFDIGRPKGCKADAESGSSRLSPPKTPKHKKHKKAKKAKRSSKR